MHICSTFYMYLHRICSDMYLSRGCWPLKPLSDPNLVGATSLLMYLDVRIIYRTVRWYIYVQSICHLYRKLVMYRECQSMSLIHIYMYHCQLPGSLAPDSTVAIFGDSPILHSFFFYTAISLTRLFGKIWTVFVSKCLIFH